MPIANVVQRGHSLHVYDERGRQLFILSAGTGLSDGLKGYTGGTVNVRRGNSIYSYDERGRQVAVTSAR